MMETQASMPLLRLPYGAALSLPPSGGELTVVAGRLWLTRGDGDEIIGAGQRVRIGAGGSAVIEAWDYGASASIRWHGGPGAAQRLAGGGLRAFAAAFLGVAGVLAEAAAGFAALARNAAAMARRAQGCIAAGDSIASSGAVK
jgi:hypothetical protein